MEVVGWIATAIVASVVLAGVVVGVRIAGQVPQQAASTQMGPWSLYASIAVVALGLYFYLSAPRGSLPWLLVVIAVATLAQTAAGLVLNSAHSGFVGAMVAIPFAVLASRLRGAPGSAPRAPRPNTCPSPHGPTSPAPTPRREARRRRPRAGLTLMPAC